MYGGRQKKEGKTRLECCRKEDKEEGIEGINNMLNKEMMKKTREKHRKERKKRLEYCRNEMKEGGVNIILTRKVIMKKRQTTKQQAIVILIN